MIQILAFDLVEILQPPEGGKMAKKKKWNDVLWHNI